MTRPSAGSMSMPIVSTRRALWTGEVELPTLTLPRERGRDSGEMGGNWAKGDHFLANRLRPAMASAAIRASSPRIRAAMTGKFAGWESWAGWPVAGRSDGVACSLAAVDAMTLGDGAAVAAGASAAGLTTITRRGRPPGFGNPMHARGDKATPEL